MKDEQPDGLDGCMAERFPHSGPDTTGAGELRSLSELLQAAAAPPVVVGDPPPTAGEEAAVAAYRSAVNGATAPRRRWRPRALRAGIGAVAAALAFGGVAVAAQAGVLHLPFGAGRPSGPRVPVPDSASARPSATSPSGDPSAGGRPASPGAAARVGGAPSSSGVPTVAPGTAAALRGLCVSYRAAQETHGGRLSAGSMRELARAAGSEAAVADYCAQLLGSSGTAVTHGGGVVGKAPAASASQRAK